MFSWQFNDYTHTHTPKVEKNWNWNNLSKITPEFLTWIEMMNFQMMQMITYISNYKKFTQALMKEPEDSIDY